MKSRPFVQNISWILIILGEILAIKLTIPRFDGQKNWCALITTEQSLSYVKAIETYARRWNIEVAFKETKQLLGLGQCQASDFDSQFAHTSAVLMSHALLVNSKYHQQWRSTGELFGHVEPQ